MVVGVFIGQVRLFGCIPCRVHTGSAIQGIDFEPGIVGDDDFSRRIAAVLFGLLAGVLLKCGAVFHNGRQGREVRDSSDLNGMRPSSSGKVP
jgi:hypothetical protein